MGTMGTMGTMAAMAAMGEMGEMGAMRATVTMVNNAAALAVTVAVVVVSTDEVTRWPVSVSFCRAVADIPTSTIDSLLDDQPHPHSNKMPSRRRRHFRETYAARILQRPPPRQVYASAMSRSVTLCNEDEFSRRRRCPESGRVTAKTANHPPGTLVERCGGF